MRSLCLVLVLVLAPFAAAAVESSTPPDDPHALAHEKGGAGHQLTVRKVDSAVEVMGKGTIQLFGARKVYDCKTGAMIADMVCDPCEIPLSTYATQPPGQWLATFSWAQGNDRERESQLSLARHFARYFDMYPSGGQVRGDHELALWVFKGPRNAGPSGIQRIALKVGGGPIGITTYSLPPGEQEVALAASALNVSGLELDTPLAFSSSCATVSPTGPRTARATLMAGRERCEVSVSTPNAAGVKGGVVLSRSVKLEVLYENQKVDTLELPANVGAVDLVGEVSITASSPEAATYKPELQWLVDPGSGELKVLSADRARFTLGKGVARGEVVLRDSRSGAEDRVVFTRSP